MEGEGEGEGSNSRMGEQYKWEPNPYLAAMVRMMMIAMTMIMIILRMIAKIMCDFEGWRTDGDNCADSCSLLHLLPHLQEQWGRIQGKDFKGG